MTAQAASIETTSTEALYSDPSTRTAPIDHGPIINDVEVTEPSSRRHTHSLSSSAISSPGDAFQTEGITDLPLEERLRRPITPKPLSRRDHVIINQEWEGYVEEVHGASFTAFLVNKTLHIRERTTFEFEEINDFDKDLVQPGNVFYWTLGYRVRPSGQRESASAVIFRRLPAWTKRDIERGLASAEETFEVFDWPEEAVEQVESS
jgi:hypothetical protein